MVDMKHVGSEADARAAAGAAGKTAETTPNAPPSKRRGGAPRSNTNAVKSGRYAEKTKPDSLGFAEQKHAQKSARARQWKLHVRRVRREGRELLGAWGLADDGASLVLGDEVTRARLLLHRLDDRNLRSLTSGGGSWVREQVAATGVVVSILSKLLDRAIELQRVGGPSSPPSIKLTLPGGAPLFDRQQINIEINPIEGIGLEVLDGEGEAPQVAPLPELKPPRDADSEKKRRGITKGAGEDDPEPKVAAKVEAEAGPTDLREMVESEPPARPRPWVSNRRERGWGAAGQIGTQPPERQPY